MNNNEFERNTLRSIAKINSDQKVPVATRIIGTTLAIVVPVQSISIACTTDSSNAITFTTDNNASITSLIPGETVNFDAGALNNFFPANLFIIDATFGTALITYIK